MVFYVSPHVLFPLLDALTPVEPPQMRHEHLRDVAAVYLFVFALLLGLVRLAAFGFQLAACLVWLFVLLASLVAALQVLVVVLALPVGPF